MRDRREAALYAIDHTHQQVWSKCRCPFLLCSQTLVLPCLSQEICQGRCSTSKPALTIPAAPLSPVVFGSWSTLVDRSGRAIWIAHGESAKLTAAIRGASPPFGGRKMHRLLKIGFRKFGEWQLSGGVLRYELTSSAPHPNTLYAFAVDGEVKYIGKTTRTLRGRLNGYVRPGPTQATNLRNHENILTSLGSGEVVEIFALPDEDLHYFGGFHLNLAAGLEDSLIKSLIPSWNGGGKATLEEEQDQRAVPEPANGEQLSKTLEITMGETYWNKGFFNTGIQSSVLFGADGQMIEMFLASETVPILGTINRTANSNHSPRIFGGRTLKEWVQAHISPGAKMCVEVLSPTSVRLYPSKALL